MFKRIAIESAFITSAIFLLMKLFSLIPLNVGALQPLDNVLDEFDMMDLYYSAFHVTDGNFSKDVVLINIGDADRLEIAELIQFVNFGAPKTIGVDVFFPTEKDRFSDSVLAFAIGEKQNVVLAAGYNEQKGVLEKSHSKFASSAVGYTNFVGDDPHYSTIRYFRPVLQRGSEEYISFGVALAKMTDSEKTAAFLNRSNETEIIRFTGNYDAFLHFEKDEILKGEIDPEIFANKIVIIGFLGNFIGDENQFEDRFFTPLNRKISGRSVPDMNGAVLHANIANMIVSGNWADRMGSFSKFLFAVVFVFLHVCLFMFLTIKWHLYFDAAAWILQVISTLLLLFVVFHVYHYFHFRMYVTLGLIGVALSVEVLFIYEALAHTLYNKYKIKSVLITES